MINKSKFSEIIGKMQECSEISDKINKIYRNSKNSFIRDFGSANVLMSANEDIVVEILKDDLGVPENDNTLEWWIWEMDYGKLINKGDFEENGHVIDVSTVDKLYDYLTGLGE